MAQQIDIPGLGIVEFPDGMSDDDIASAIKKNIMPTLPATSTVGAAGRTLAGFADSILGAPGALANQIGYAGARAIGRSPEEAKKAEIFETQPLARAFGVGNSPEYRSEASQRLNAFIGENVGKGAKWISEQTGRPQEDIENIIGTLAMGAGVKTAPYTTPIAKKAIGVVGQAAENAVVGTAKGAAKGAKAVASVPGDVVKGVNNALKTDIPQSSVKMSEETLQQTREPNQTSLRRDDGTWDPKQVKGTNRFDEMVVRMSDKEIPIQGRVIENMAETAARGYKELFTGRGNQRLGGLQGAADIAGLFGMGLPVGSMMRAGIPAAIRGLAPLRAVDPADIKGMSVGGKPVTSDIFTTRTGIPFWDRRDVNYFQDPIPENAGRRTYDRTVNPEDMPTYEKPAAPRPAPEKWTADKGWPGGPAPLRIGHTMYASEGGSVGGDMNAVMREELNKKYAPQKADEPVAPSAPLPAPDVVPEPVAPSAPKVFGQAQLDALKQKLLAQGTVTEKGPGKREANAANKLYKEENLKKTISEWSNSDSPVRNIATQPVDTTDMDNATRGMYNMLKKAGGGVFDEIPSMEWLKDHGITEQAFIRRLVGGSRPKNNPSPVAPTTSTPKPTTVNLETITPEPTMALPAPVNQARLPAPEVPLAIGYDKPTPVEQPKKRTRKAKAEPTPTMAQTLGVPESVVPPKPQLTEAQKRAAKAEKEPVGAGKATEEAAIKAKLDADFELRKPYMLKNSDVPNSREGWEYYDRKNLPPKVNGVLNTDEFGNTYRMSDDPEIKKQQSDMSNQLTLNRLKTQENNKEKAYKALNEELGIPKTIVEKIRKGKEELTQAEWNKIQTLASAKKLDSELLKLEGVSYIKFILPGGKEIYPFKQPGK